MSGLPLLDRAMTPAERNRLLRGSSAKKRGHAAPSGSGPDDQTCGSCRHLWRGQMSKTFFKCSLMRPHWTGGYGTDVRCKDAACRLWEVAADPR